ncbi:hypothetical protein ACFQL0_16700 [Haloplanus litoreus]|uniref:hypothetical protein n=1 Tax=Haloplanus litoreus TaxID=767515 RepID=UPI003615B49D
MTRGVAPSSTYTLELQYFFENGNTDGVDVVVVDADNRELDRFSLDQSQTRSNTGLAEDSFTLNQDATDYISNDGNLYLRYETTASSGATTSSSKSATSDCERHERGDPTTRHSKYDYYCGRYAHTARSPLPSNPCPTVPSPTPSAPSSWSVS